MFSLDRANNGKNASNKDQGIELHFDDEMDLKFYRKSTGYGFGLNKIDSRIC